MQNMVSKVNFLSLALIALRLAEGAFRGLIGQLESSHLDKADTESLKPQLQAY